MHIISKGVLMLLTENYQNWSMLVETTAFQSWRVVFRHSVVHCCALLSLLSSLQTVNTSLTLPVLTDGEFPGGNCPRSFCQGVNVQTPRSWKAFGMVVSVSQPEGCAYR